MSKLKRGRQWILVPLSLFLITANAQERYEFSVKDAVDYGLKNSVQVKNQLEAIKIQRETNKEVTAMAYPQINASSAINHFPQVAKQTFPNFISAATYGVLETEGVKDGNGNAIISPGDFGFIQAQFGTKYNTSFGAEFSWILFDGQVFVGLKARGAVLKLAEKTKEVTEEQIKANIYKVYYQLVVGRKQTEAVDANIALLEKLLKDQEVMFNNGFIEKLDMDKTSVSLTNLKTEKSKIENALANGNAGLKFLMGMPQQDELLLTDTLSTGEILNDISETSYNYTDRKDFQQIEIAERLGQYNVKRYQLSKLPTLAAFGSYSKITQGNTLSFKNTFPSSVVGVKLSVPLFEGFAKNARISKTISELNQTKNTKEMLKQSIDMEVVQARNNIHSSLLTMQSQEKNTELAQQVYNVTKKKYEQGLSSNLDILNAQTEFRTAQVNYYSAIYDAIIAKIDYLKATGKL